jgi:hypothetical protein
VDAKQREQLIAQYRDGYRAVAEALLKITDEELDAMRLRLLLAEDRPAIKGFDQDEFARKLYYDRPHESSLEAFRWARQTTAELLERLGPAEWMRQGTHSEIGPFGVEEWLKIYGPHAHRHARQIREARTAVTK